MSNFRSELQRVRAELNKASTEVKCKDDERPKSVDRVQPAQDIAHPQHVVRSDVPVTQHKSVQVPSLPSAPVHPGKHAKPLVSANAQRQPATRATNSFNAPLLNWLKLQSSTRATNSAPSEAKRRTVTPAPLPSSPKVQAPLLRGVDKTFRPSPKGQAPLLIGVDKTFRPLPKGQLTRQRLFKLPEPWVGLGGQTQLVAPATRSGVDVVIGLDFGTAYTKAAVGFMDKIFPVTWEGISNCTPGYLLPSEYTVLADGSLFIGQHSGATAKEIRGDLKLPFINPAASTASIATASGFLALVLRYIRSWVYHRHADKLGKASIRWQLNLGSPSNGLENPRLEAAYRELATSSWIRSLCTDSSRVADCAAGLWQEGPTLQDLVDLQIRPEFVAQMAGYMQSPQRQRGLHALIDVGGGTLDVVTFNVHKVDDEDTFPFLVPQIHPLGTHGVIQNRLSGLPLQTEHKSIDELEPIPSSTVFAAMVGIDEAHVNMRDKIFSDEVRGVIRAVFDITKARRYRLSDAWTSSVRTFITGGGAQLALYQLATRSAKVPAKNGLYLMQLPPHPKIDGFSGNSDEYQRISVACGLAQDAFTLGRIVPAKEVEDDRPVTSISTSTRVERPDRDELYPK